MASRAVRGTPPTIVNSSVRTRKYLTAAEVERLQAAARKFSRWAHRDATMILLGYRHGLRASELCDLQWSQVELATGRLHVRRAKNGTASVHPLRGEELRALRRLQRECGPSPYVFQSERGGPMTPKSFHALFGRIGVWAKMPFPIHPHMLRHGCGYALADAGHDTRRCRLGSDTETSSTRCATPSWRRTGSRTSGASGNMPPSQSPCAYLDNNIVSAILDSEQFRSTPRTCGRFRGILSLR